jgi:hypothetical protein
MTSDAMRAGYRVPGIGYRSNLGPAVPAGRCQGRRRGRLASRRGQTTTEYLMIAGIITAIGILILLWMFQPWRETVEDVADCVRTDDCEPVGAQ